MYVLAERIRKEFRVDFMRIVGGKKNREKIKRTFFFLDDATAASHFRLGISGIFSTLKIFTSLYKKYRLIYHGIYYSYVEKV